MPNWVKNNVTFEGPESALSDIQKLVQSEERAFDFNKIIPMPEALNLESGSTEDLAIACAKSRRETGNALCGEYTTRQWAQEKTPEEWADLGEKYLKNQTMYGASTWYEWCIRNWGTKWNASEPSWEDKNLVTFETAWSTPEPIFDRLASMFPNVEITVEYADEDMGNNCGRIVYNSENPLDKFAEDIETLEFACEVWGYDKNEYLKEIEDSGE